MPINHRLMKTAPQQRKRRGEWRICPQCGDRFYLVPSRVKRDELFCSVPCRLESKKVEKVCPECGKTFKVNRSIADRYTVCSRACRTANTKYVSCERCGKVFRAEKHLNRRYCSEVCRRPPKYINCRNCGKEFRTLPGDKDRQFCCLACYRKYQGETLLEKTVRQILDSIELRYVQEAMVGRYSVDFLIPELRVALEVDGDYWHRDASRDARKTKFLVRKGWSVIRVSDTELENSRNPASIILHRLKEVANSDLVSRYPSLSDFPNRVVKR